MIVKSINYISTDLPYGNMDAYLHNFMFHLDDDTEIKVSIDIWCRPAEMIYDIFCSALRSKELDMLDFSKYIIWTKGGKQYHNGPKFENLTEIWRMYVDIITSKGLCPHSKESLLMYPK